MQAWSQVACTWNLLGTGGMDLEKSMGGFWYLENIRLLQTFTNYKHAYSVHMMHMQYICSTSYMYDIL